MLSITCLLYTSSRRFIRLSKLSFSSDRETSCPGKCRLSRKSEKAPAFPPGCLIMMSRVFFTYTRWYMVPGRISSIKSCSCPQHSCRLFSDVYKRQPLEYCCHTSLCITAQTCFIFYQNMADDKISQ